MMPNAIVILAGGFKRDKGGVWHSSDFEGSDCGPPVSHIRILAGRYLYEENPQRCILVSGGRGECNALLESGITLSAIMKRELVESGIPENAILEDSLSNNTYQSLRNLIPFIQRHGLREITLVSSGHHHLERIGALLHHIPAFAKLKDAATLVSAEEIVSARDPRSGALIREAYGKEPFPRILASERAGVEQIRKGTYRLG